MSDKNIITQSANKFSDHYEDNPLTSVLLTALSLAVPQLAIGKEVIDRAVTKIQQERFQTLIDELAKGEKYLTPEIIETEEFIHSFVVVYRAVINTYQREKIRLFARILLSAVEKDELASDKFEEFTRVLNDISLRELEILNLLSHHEKNNPHQIIEEKNVLGELVKQELENDFQRTNKFWDIFIVVASEKFSLTPNDILALLAGLNRTGMYETFSGAILGYSGGKGQTSSLFKEFIEWIKIEDEINAMIYKDEANLSD